MPRGRPQTVTVMFTDLVGSTAWRTRVGELVADERTAELDSATRDVITAAGGFVVKSMGDGVMATFPTASVALEAASSLQQIAHRLAVGGTEACLRVGVSTGEMVREGDDWMGSAAIEASRLCADAAGGSVLVADVTARLGRGRTDHGLRSIGERTLRGFDEPIEVFELVPASSRDPVLPRALAVAATGPLVGRVDEMAHVDAALKDVAGGAAVTMLIVGEPGVGKTRLAAAAAQIAVENGFTVLHGRCDEGSAGPYQPVIDALTPWLNELPDVVLRRIAGDDGSRLASLWPELATRLETVDNSAGDPESERWRLFEAVRALVGSVGQPLLLVVDDLQWAEPSTRALLGHLVRRPSPSTGVLGTARRGGDPSSLFGDLGTSAVVDTVELGGLPADGVTELVGLHVGHRPPDQLARHLWRQTDGNPFFLGALLVHLDHVATIRDESGTWATASALTAAGVPDDVRAVVRRRLARLGDDARRALDVAAVSGLAFDEAIVRCVLERGVDETVAAMDEALAVGVVREEGAGRYAFVHALVRDTVVEDLSSTRLARLHWRTGEELERRPDRAARLDEIALHYSAAGELGDDRTRVRASLAAGDDAMARLAFDEAAAHFRTALAALDRLPPDADVRYRVLTSLGRALNALADGEGSDPLWLEAAAIAEVAQDPQRIFDALLGYDYVVRLEDQSHVVRLLGVVLGLVGPGDSPLRARAMAWQHTHKMRAMGLAPDRGDLDEAVAMARRTGDQGAVASTLQARLAVIGQGPDAAAMLRDAEELASLDVPRDSHWMLTSRDIARALLRLGRRADAEAHVAANRVEAARSGLGMAINGALMLQATIATASGDFAAGKRLAAEAAGRPAGQTDIVALAYAAQLVALWYEEGRVDAVIASLRQLEPDRPAFAPWCAMLASVLAEAGRLDEAADQMRRLMPRFEHGYTTLYGGPVAVRYSCEACLHLETRAWAEVLVPHVEPWSGILLVVNTCVEGAADRSLGHLLATLGRLDEADAAYSAAGDLERRAGFPPLYARTAYWHARTLLERDRAGDRARAAGLLDETIGISDRLGMRLVQRQAIELSSAAAG